MHELRERAESFGSVAEDYDRFRPSYPPQLFDDLVARHPVTALDVGCGTGKAARELAGRGVDVLGLEIDPRMAAVARRHGVTVEVSSFETWAAAGRRFDLITAAQSWHWIDPVLGAIKAADLLRPAGTLALFWNHDKPETEFDDVYEALAPQLMADRSRVPSKPTYAEGLAASGRFAEITTREYPWSRTYTTDQWVGYVRTHSDHATLPPDQLDAVTSALRDAIDARGATLTVQGGTYTICARTDTA